MNQGCTNHEIHVALTNEFCTVAPNICGSSGCNIIYVTVLAPRMLGCVLEYSKIYRPGLYWRVSSYRLNCKLFLGPNTILTLWLSRYFSLNINIFGRPQSVTLYLQQFIISVAGFVDSCIETPFWSRLSRSFSRGVHLKPLLSLLLTNTNICINVSYFCSY